MMKKIATTALAAASIALGTASIAHAENPGCPSCNQGGGSIGDGYVHKTYSCGVGQIADAYMPGSSTLVLSDYCPATESSNDDD